MSSSENALELRLESFRFPAASAPILRDISLIVRRGERVAIMGASASGKTTLLKICAGLKDFHVPGGVCTRAGRFSMLFQENVLLDYLTVRDNITLPASLSGYNNDIAGIAQSLHIGHLLDAYPKRLSGGERKRTAIARALAYPDLVGLIMDEGFVALDLYLKEAILADLKNRLDAAGLACIFSTHSAEEAVYLADRILIIGQKPSSIVKSISVDIARDKGHDTFQDESFQKMVMEVSSELRSMHLAFTI